MPTKPVAADIPRWADVADPADIVEPPTGLKDAGWQPNTRPPAEYFNWLFNRLYRWIAYLNDTAQIATDVGPTLATIARTWTAIQTFSAGIAGAVSNQSNPLIDATGTVAGGYRLHLRAYLGTTMRLRVYTTTTDLVISLNCAWNNTGNVWEADVTGSCALYQFTRTDFRVWRRASATAGSGFNNWDTDSTNPKTTLTLATGWASVTAGTTDLQIYRSPDGRIYCDGYLWVSSGSGRVNIVDPGGIAAGSRPAFGHWFTAEGNGGSRYLVTVGTDGSIQVPVGVSNPNQLQIHANWRAAL